MRVPNPSPVLDRNRAPMGPEILSSAGAGVWGKFHLAFQTPVLYWINISLRGRLQHFKITPSKYCKFQCFWETTRTSKCDFRRLPPIETTPFRHYETCWKLREKSEAILPENIHPNLFASHAFRTQPQFADFLRIVVRQRSRSLGHPTTTIIFHRR